MALPTKGRVVIDTTAGEIDIELWSKVRAPEKLTPNILRPMEGYYDGVIFHRIVPDFLVQTGDRTGTGAGGESFYGEPFEDEIHPRLRFAHRGLVAMANNGTKNSNDSQFFITLDRADELHGKHTLFGRCVGDTIYNVMKIGAMEIDKDGRPLYPPKIRSIRIIDNPFDDIVPRITAEEKTRATACSRTGETDTKLLSFGADEDIETGEADTVVFKKKNIARPDLADNPEQPAMIPDITAPKSGKLTKSDDRVVGDKKEQPSATTEDLTSIREKHMKEQAASISSRQAEIERMEAEIKKLSKRRNGDDSDEETSKKKAKSKSYLEEELAKYSKGRGLHRKDKKKDESDILATLTSFRSKLKSAAPAGDANATEEVKPEPGDVPPTGENEEGMEVDDDTGFLSHILDFPKGNDEEMQKAERDYEVIDPRKRGARAKEEERERKRVQQAKRGGRGYRR
ncbi:hypothetical protein EW146_g3042 [Bondarzewia mesenterica]|uniref:PPIase cyclophilin-type domain-containing protein n=1 Tax=Bondarzewia mesenterica TaxID=1095465 RepID=A0A4S4LYV5_9AGAM|nr:hypothetical protein EW146_g3042 [Bondarzewia mesenterica]